MTDQGPGEKAHENGSSIAIDDFELVAVVGKGRYGKMHQAIRERQLLECLDHPYIVKLHCAFQSPTKLYFVLDWINGGELYFHLKHEGLFSEARVRLYGAELVLALEHLHSKRIMYRDIKLENVLLDSEGHVRLTDFGLAKQLTATEERTQTFCGTPEYMGIVTSVISCYDPPYSLNYDDAAPEVINMMPYDFAVDWWCLGALLYELIHGLPPFYSPNLSELYERVLSNEPLPLRDNISNEAKSLFRGLLERDPNRRLGCGRGGVDRVKRHPFFAGIDWGALQRRDIPAPFIPSGDPLANFESEFTGEQPIDSPMPPRHAHVMLDQFSYADTDTSGGAASAARSAASAVSARSGMERTPREGGWSARSGSASGGSGVSPRTQRAGGGLLSLHSSNVIRG